MSSTTLPTPAPAAKPKSITGFSLVELSIVLVILGLLVGGILSGQALIRASEMRAVTTEFQLYITAIATFRDKYFALPGDYTASWGKSIGAGDNDGIIENETTVQINEIAAFWGQLGQTGLLEGTFTTIGSSSSTTMTAGTNNPRSKISNAAWNIGYLGDMGVDGTNGSASGVTAPDAATFYAGTYGHVLLFGSGSNALMPGGVLRSDEAWNIDTKMDDGKPDRGKLLTLESQGSASAGAGCGNRAGATTALAASDYDLANTSKTACAFVFGTGF